MKYYLRIFFISIMLMCSIGARAEWVPQWSEDFSNLEGSNGAFVRDFGNWTLDKCYVAYNGDSSNKAFKIGSSENGSATTPSLSVTGFAMLTFTCSKNKDAVATLLVSITGGGSVVGSTSITPSGNTHTSRTLYLKDLTTDSKIVFSSSGVVYIDNIVVSTPSTITMNQDLDNSSVLTTNQDGVVNVATVRTLREGIWNTLCLPFAVNKEVIDDALGEGCKVSTYTSYANNVMTFSPSTVNSNTSIAAGTPFLIKVNATVTNPTFKAVTITTTTPGVVTDNGVSFVGCYSSTEMATDGTELFIGTDNYMYKPEEGKNIIGGLRAFIRRSNTAGSRMSVNIDEESLAVTAPAKMERTEPTAYTLQGVRTNAAKKGVYIVDGKKRVIR